MATQKQIKANRKNSKKSTGPKSDKGKAVVKQNALKHGVYAQDLILKGGMVAEQVEEFHELAESLMNDLQPVGILETILVEKIAASIWRLKRVLRAEQGSFQNRIELIESFNLDLQRPYLHFWKYREPIDEQEVAKRFNMLEDMREWPIEKLSKHQWFIDVAAEYELENEEYDFLTFWDMKKEDRNTIEAEFRDMLGEDMRALGQIILYQRRLQSQHQEALIPSERLTKEEERLERSMLRDIATLKELQAKRADR